MENVCKKSDAPRVGQLVRPVFVQAAFGLFAIEAPRGRPKDLYGLGYRHYAKVD